MINKRWFNIHMGEVVTFSKEFDNDLGGVIGLEKGMKARISKVTSDNGGYVVWFNFSDFEEYNKQFMKIDYYDKNGVPCLRWDETPYYPPDCLEDVWLPNDEDMSKYFSLVEG